MQNDFKNTLCEIEVCVCVCARARQRESVCVCVTERTCPWCDVPATMCVFVFVCARERERESERERERAAVHLFRKTFSGLAFLEVQSLCTCGTQGKKMSKGHLPRVVYHQVYNVN